MGWGANRNSKKNPGRLYAFIVASGKMFKGSAIRNPKYNPGIDFYSGFRKSSQGGCNMKSATERPNNVPVLSHYCPDAGPEPAV